VVIKASHARHLDALLGDLGAASASKRDAAVARLTVVGAGAVVPLAALVRSNDVPRTRIAALRAIEAIGDLRGLPPALAAIDDPDANVAAAAVATSSAFLRSARGSEVVDRLATVALDARRPEALRIATIHALRALESSTLAPLVAALLSDPLETIRGALGQVAPISETVDTQTVAEMTRLASADLGDDPVTVRAAIANARAMLPLNSLVRILERIREREQTPPTRQHGEWTAARGTVHVVLASRGSRLGLYDIRESLERATAPLPADFIEALRLVGDRECLDAIAAAHPRSGRSGRGSHEAWRQQLGAAFREIRGRERLTKRHLLMKKIEKRWPDALRRILDA
jgi:HEAT repeat protein